LLPKIQETYEKEKQTRVEWQEKYESERHIRMEAQAKYESLSRENAEPVQEDVDLTQVQQSETMEENNVESALSSWDDIESYLQILHEQISNLLSGKESDTQVDIPTLSIVFRSEKGRRQFCKIITKKRKSVR
jgi:hypothetical protein